MSRRIFVSRDIDSTEHTCRLVQHQLPTLARIAHFTQAHFGSTEDDIVLTLDLWQDILGIAAPPSPTSIAAPLPSASDSPVFTATAPSHPSPPSSPLSSPPSLPSHSSLPSPPLPPHLPPSPSLFTHQSSSLSPPSRPSHTLSAPAPIPAASPPSPSPTASTLSETTHRLTQLEQLHSTMSDRADRIRRKLMAIDSASFLLAEKEGRLGRPFLWIQEEVSRVEKACEIARGAYLTAVEEAGRGEVGDGPDRGTSGPRQSRSSEGAGG